MPRSDDTAFWELVSQIGNLVDFEANGHATDVEKQNFANIAQFSQNYGVGMLKSRVEMSKNLSHKVSILGILPRKVVRITTSPHFLRP